MLKNLGKNVTKSIIIGISIGLGIFITFATDISLLSQTVVTGDKITKDWFNAVNSGITLINTNITSINNKLTNVYNDGTNIGIGSATPNYKLHVVGTIMSEWDNSTSKIPTLILRRLSSGVFDGSAITIDNGMGMGLSNITAGATINSGGTGYNYLGTRGASNISMGDGTIGLNVGGTTGTAGSPVTLTGGLYINSSANVGIGNTSPTQKLDVTGTIKATNLETNGSTVVTKLAHCGGPCASYHALSTWVNVGSYNYTWITPINTNTTIFTSNNHGVITVNKAGLYLVKENIFMIPTADTSRLAASCPFINGVANCGSNPAAEIYGHNYYKAGRWGTKSGNLYFQLNAGDTVSYGYYIYQTMTNWAHDDYTSLIITRIN